MQGLRKQGRAPSAVSDALAEFVRDTGMFDTPGTFRLSSDDYHNLSGAEKTEVDNLYQKCLGKAMQEFPDIFSAG